MSIPLKNYTKEKKIFFQRIVIASFFIFLLVLILVLRLFYLQIICGRKYYNLSQKNYVAFVNLEPNRGLIYDRNGVLLAKNVPVFSLEILPNMVKKIDDTIGTLSGIIKITEEEKDYFAKMRKIHSRFDSIPLKIGLTEDEIAKISVNLYKLKGVSIGVRFIRKYLPENNLANIVGYTGRISPEDLYSMNMKNYSTYEYVGKSGIERYYESLLHGHPGFKTIEFNAAGKILKYTDGLNPVSGSDIYLTIDTKLQKVAIDALGKETGAAVAIDPKTGEVLAMVTNPTFDPNIFVAGEKTKIASLVKNPLNPLYNRAISGNYPIASTIKPYIAIAALNYGIIDKDDTFFDRGFFTIDGYKHTYRDWAWRRGGRGIINVSKAIIVSSDTFFYNLAVILTIKNIDKALSLFGFGSKTGIDLPEESTGILATPDWKMHTIGLEWFPGDTVNAGIGQGYMQATPIQLAHAVSIIANRGKVVKPHLLLMTISPYGEKEIIKPEITNKIELKDKSIWNIVIKAMENVIKSPMGTAHTSFGKDVSYTIAAKTGTGQVYSKNGSDEDASMDEKIPKKLRNHSLFIAFAPVENPKIAVGIVVEHANSAPTVARKIIDYYLNQAR